jgi:hypothetical protein
VHGPDGKDGGNVFGGLTPQATAAALAKASGGVQAANPDPRLPLPATRAPLWQAPKPEAPDAGLHAGFLSDGDDAGLLQTDFRALAPEGGLTWTARLAGLKAGEHYANRLEGIVDLPKGMAVALADPATGRFVPLSAGQNYVVEAQSGEQVRDLQIFVGSPEYVQSRGTAFAAEHPFSLELRNFPNPVRGYTIVKFAVPASAAGRQRVRLTVYDMQGRLVKVLALGPKVTGRYSLHWDARDPQGRPIAAGVYRLMLEVGGRKLDRSLQILP